MSQRWEETPATRGFGWFLAFPFVVVLGAIEAWRQDWKIVSYWSEKVKTRRK
jgi:hypothetical protein